MYSPAWPHGQIKEILPNIFMVTGTNIIKHDNAVLQHSRNMIIVRDGNALSLINTVRLQDNALITLESLGDVQNIIRIGAFHGRDDLFYIDRYSAKLWALKGMVHDHNHTTDIEMVSGSKMPFDKGSFFVFETAKQPEGALHIAQEGGILITCDSIKNWLAPDQFFNAETAKTYEDQGLFGAASISTVWKKACNVKSSDFARLKTFSFHHLLSAHGEPLLNNAYELVAKTIRQEYGV